MNREKARLLQVKFVVADVVATVLAYFLAYWIRDSLLAVYFGEIYPLPSYLWMVVVAMVSVPAIFSLLKLYQVVGVVEEEIPFYRKAGSLLQGVFLEYVLISVLIFTFKLQYVSRLFVLVFIGMELLLLVLARAGLWPGFMRQALKDPLGVLMVGSGEHALEIASLLATKSRIGIRLLGVMTKDVSETPWLGGYPVLGSIEEAESVLASHVIDEVWISMPETSPNDLDPLLLLCEQQGITARLVCDFLPQGSARFHLEQLEGIPLLSFTTTPNNATLLALKRVTDVVGGSLLLIFSLPFFVVVPILIRLTSKGPIFYRQVRCGLNGRLFTFLKFRSMVDGADEKRNEIAYLNEAEGPIFKISADPRVTKFGRILRRTSIDELPQLFNVLKGDMSLVGPRPPLPEEVQRYQGWHRRRLSMKPGLTCLWQVSGRSELSFDEWVALDLKYMEEWSLWLDFQIMFNTIPAVLLRKGAW